MKIRIDRILCPNCKHEKNNGQRNLPEYGGEIIRYCMAPVPVMATVMGDFSNGFPVRHASGSGCEMFVERTAMDAAIGYAKSLNWEQDQVVGD